MKSKQIMLIAVALGCGLLSAIGIIQAMGNKSEGAPKIPMAPVVVATTHLDQRTKLSDENVKLENWPVNLIPEGSATDLGDVRGKIITNPLSKGQAVIQQTVLPESEIPELAIPPGHKVINIKVPPEDAMVGLMHPGSRVDIIGVFRVRDKKTGQTEAETLTFLKGIRVFNIGSSVSAHQSKAVGPSGIVGVLVTEPQSEKIVHARKNGEIRLALIGEQDADSLEDPSDPLFPWEEDDDSQPEESQFQVAKAPERPRAVKFMTIYTSSGVTKVAFDEDDNVIQQAEVSTGNGSGSSYRPPQAPAAPVDYEKSDDSEELDNGIEEDQYSAE